MPTGVENKGTKRKSLETEENKIAKKLQKVLKEGPIQDYSKLFNDLAMDISDKYEEVGLELGLPYKTLRSELESGLTLMLQGHKKATRMLHLWKDTADEESFTYKVLADALEKRGLQRCAYDHCYTSSLVTEK